MRSYLFCCINNHTAPRAASLFAKAVFCNKCGKKAYRTDGYQGVKLDERFIKDDDKEVKVARKGTRFSCIKF